MMMMKAQRRYSTLNVHIFILSLLLSSLLIYTKLSLCQQPDSPPPPTTTTNASSGGSTSNAPKSPSSSSSGAVTDPTKPGPSTLMAETAPTPPAPLQASTSLAPLTSTSVGTPSSSGTTVAENDANKDVVDYGDAILESLNFLGDQMQQESLLAKHHNYEEMQDYLQTLHRTYPEVTKLYSIGESVERRQLWVLTLSEQPNEHIRMKPEFRYIANMHGNEVVGRELLLHLARLLLENYRALSNELPGDTTPTGPKFVKKLLQSTRIHLLFSMNPDGYERSTVGCKYEDISKRGRLNANNINLNRNFPDPVIKIDPAAATQPEVLAFMQWSHSEPFVLSANLHGGALVVNYPYDGATNTSADKEPRPTPDDDIFRDISLTYSRSHPTMHTGVMCYDKCTEYHPEVFPDGIVNGASWYSLYGGLQDWVYENTNEMDVTIELGCNQYPNAVDLPQYWRYNKKALLRFMLNVHRGIKGTVQDVRSGQYLANVTVHILDADRPNRLHNITTSSYGDYFRLLMPGRYNILFDRAGYYPSQMFVQVDAMAQIHQIKLTPLDGATPSALLPSAPGSLPPMVINAGGDGGESSSNNDEHDDHSIVVATLVMTVIIVLILILMGGAYVIQRRRLTRSQSVSVELQPRSASTGFGLPPGQVSSGSSTNPHLAA